MENTREELKARALYLLNGPIQHAAMIATITGENAEKIFDDTAQAKILAAQLFAQALFDEEIIVDSDRGFIFKEDADAAPETVEPLANGVC